MEQGTPAVIAFTAGSMLSPSATTFLQGTKMLHHPAHMVRKPTKMRCKCAYLLSRLQRLFS
jgi:hypothetical protein